MRPHTTAVALLLAGSPPAVADPAEEAGRIAALVRQLGHDEYARREEASQALEAAGEPALSALRKAANSDDDPETRHRAVRIIRVVTGRARAAATKKALEELQGTWSLVTYHADGRLIKGEDARHTFTFAGDKWSIHVGGRLSQGGTVTVIGVGEKLNAIDLRISEGGNTGVTATSIYAVEGDTLKYLNSGEPRAAEFATKPGDGRNYLVFRRAKP
jgi:uncharacterized protein (TIGR03067 family)